jgi:cytochrome c5
MQLRKALGLIKGLRRHVSDADEDVIVLKLLAELDVAGYEIVKNAGAAANFSAGSALGVPKTKTMEVANGIAINGNSVRAEKASMLAIAMAPPVAPDNMARNLARSNMQTRLCKSRSGAARIPGWQRADSIPSVPRPGRALSERLVSESEGRTMRRLLWPRAAGAVLLAFAAEAAQLTELPEGPNRELVSKVCQGCHDLQMVLDAAGTSRAEWDMSLDEMTANGMNLSADDRAKVLTYLSTYLGPTPPKSATGR